MKPGLISTGLAVAFGALSLYLGYASMDLALWNDDLREGSRMNVETIDDLVAYVSIDTPCNLTPQQLAEALNAGRTDQLDRFAVLENGEDPVEVVHAGFRAKFSGGQLQTVGDINHGEVSVCKEA